MVCVKMSDLSDHVLLPISCEEERYERYHSQAFIFRSLTVKVTASSSCETRNKHIYLLFNFAMSVSSELAFDSHHRINITMLIRLSFVAQCLAEVHVQF